MENLLKKITGIKSETPNRWNIPSGIYRTVKSMCRKILWQVTIAKCMHITLTII